MIGRGLQKSLIRSSTLLIFYLPCLLSEIFPGMLFPRESQTRQVKELNGIWKFRADRSEKRNAGFEQMWWSDSLDKTGSTIPMPVPASYNDITQDNTLREFIGWVWYETETFVPLSWNDENTRVVLRFESAHYNSVVWLNGKEVMNHSGGHLPFEADISDKLSFGELNRITAAINNTLTPTTLPPGDIEWKNGSWYPPGYFVQTFQFDFFNYAGIHRPVKLYRTPTLYLDDITIITDYDENNDMGYVTFKAVVAALSGIAKDEISMQYHLLDSNGTMVASEKGTGLFSGQLVVQQPNLWWPVGMNDIPGYLYTLQITSSSGKLVDIYRLHVGIRTVKVSGNKFLINNRPFYFKGFGMHEDSNIRGKGMDWALITKDFNLINWIGANSFRTSHYPYADEIMDMADQQGIVVIDESPGVGIQENNFGEDSLEHHLQVMQELVRRDKNRPGVVMWSVANEPKSDIPIAEPYFKKVFEYTRSLDSSRPVTFVSCKQPTKDVAVQFVDVVCYNRYYAWYNNAGHLELISRQFEAELNDWYNVFKRPVLLTEYGADTIAGFHSNPPVMFTEDYQVETILRYFPVMDKYRKEFLIGEMIWNFADFMTVQGITRVVGNKKGIFTRDRQPKAAAHVLRARYLNISMAEEYTGDSLLNSLLKYKEPRVF